MAPASSLSPLSWRAWAEVGLFRLAVTYLRPILDALCAARRFVGWYQRPSFLLVTGEPLGSHARRVNALSAIGPPPRGSVRIVCISDTHGHHRHIRQLPSADLLVHCGDILYESSKHDNEAAAMRSLLDFNNWIGSFSQFSHKLVIAGNHDGLLQQLGKERTQRILSHCTYLENEAWDGPAGLRVFATPYSRPNSASSPNRAFQLGETAASALIDSIPPCDVLITHGPPEGYGDDAAHQMSGCSKLASKVQQLRPALHLFGHCHQSAGVSYAGGTCYVNACVVDVMACPTNPAVIITVGPRTEVG